MTPTRLGPLRTPGAASIVGGRAWWNLEYRSAAFVRRCKAPRWASRRYSASANPRRSMRVSARSFRRHLMLPFATRRRWRVFWRSRKVGRPSPRMPILPTWRGRTLRAPFSCRRRLRQVWPQPDRRPKRRMRIGKVHRPRPWLSTGTRRSHQGLPLPRLRRWPARERLTMSASTPPRRRRSAKHRPISMSMSMLTSAARIGWVMPGFADER